MTSALIISAIISYLLGSLNFGIIISKSLSKDEVTEAAMPVQPICSEITVKNTL